MIIEVVTPTGQIKSISLEHFPPMDGWEIQNNFVRFAASTDKDFRRAYTMEILSYAKVMLDNDKTLPLTTNALIDNHLCDWKNVQIVFEETLRYNGIEPTSHANKSAFWSEAGAEMAISFIAEASKLMGPALEMASKAHTSE
jgi:hypothetical protein